MKRSHRSTQLYEDHKTRERILAQVPLRQLGQVDQMAGVAAFLCSRDAAYVTGEGGDG